MLGTDIWLALSVSDHMTAGDVVVGAGTLALAGATVWLAVMAKREAKASTDSTILARESIERQDRPYVIPTPPKEPKLPAVAFVEGRPRRPAPERNIYGEAISETSHYLAVGLWNIGHGPAFIEGISFRDENDEERVTPVESEILVHPGGQADKLGELVEDYFLPASGSRCVLRIVYRDVSDVRYETRADVKMRLGDECEIENFSRSRLPDPPEASRV